MAARKPAARDAQRPEKPAPVTVVLPNQVPKVHSIRFETPVRPVPFDNLYLKAEGFEQLGRPPKIRVTVEGVWDD
jgi:hypothetical protein